MKSFLLLICCYLVATAISAQTCTYSSGTVAEATVTACLGATTNCDSLNPCNIRITGDVTITADWDLTAYDYVRFIITPTGEFTTDGNNTTLMLSSTSLVIVENGGAFKFDGGNGRVYLTIGDEEFKGVVGGDNNDLAGVVSGGGADANGPCPCSNNPLPVGLIDFDIEAGMGGLTAYWSTASEVDHDYFTLEESANGFDYLPVVEIDGAGNSTQIKHYTHTFRPLHEATERLYFRLKQSDFDGSVVYSKVITEEWGFQKPGRLVAYPNPVTDGQLFVMNPGGAVRQIKVMDLIGRTVLDQPAPEEDAQHRLTLTMPEVSPGIYHVLLVGELKSYTARIFISN